MNLAKKMKFSMLVNVVFFYPIALIINVTKNSKKKILRIDFCYKINNQFGEKFRIDSAYH